MPTDHLRSISRALWIVAWTLWLIALLLGLLLAGPAEAAPSISSTGVRPYTTYRTPGLREIEAGGVARAATVEWLLDGELRHVDEDGPPWTWPWSITAGDNGERRVTARAVDAAGQTSQRSAFPIRVQIPGVVVPPPDPEPEPEPEPEPQPDPTPEPTACPCVVVEPDKGSPWFLFDVDPGEQPSAWVDCRGAAVLWPENEEPTE